MTRHYLKLIWNRKRTNLLIAIEIFFSFLVVFGVFAMSTYYVDNYRQPLGFWYDDVWTIRVTTREVRSPGSDTSTAAVAETKRQLEFATREFAETVSAATAFTTPYGHSRWMTSASVNGRDVDYSVNAVTDPFAEVMGIRVINGRWFNAEDDGVAWRAVVINQRLARDLFGEANPVGRSVPQGKPDPGEVRREMKVVGLVQDFRQDGEFGQPENYMLQRGRVADAADARMMETLVLKVKPGTTAAFEEKLVKRLQAAAPAWSFEVETLEESRASRHKATLVPLLAAAVIAGFLMLMVAMGLTGVLWQTVTQRTREVGLRRAKGATVRDIRAQILGELAVMSTIAILAGSAVVLQFPLLKQLGFVSAGVYATALVISAVCIYLLTLVCGWYPSRLATAIPPAEALRYE